MTEDEFVLPEGHVLVKCPKCEYTNDVPEGHAEDDDWIAEHCERCNLPDVEHVKLSGSMQIPKAARDDIIEKSVASASIKLVALAEQRGQSDISFAEVGTMVANEAIAYTLGMLEAEQEVRRAHDLIASRFLAADPADDGAGGDGVPSDDVVVEPSDGPEPA